MSLRDLIDYINSKFNATKKLDAKIKRQMDDLERRVIDMTQENLNALRAAEDRLDVALRDAAGRVNAMVQSAADQKVTIDNQDAQIASLNEQVTSLTTQVNDLTNRITELEANPNNGDNSAEDISGDINTLGSLAVVAENLAVPPTPPNNDDLSQPPPLPA